jgi:hypothetical protein
MSCESCGESGVSDWQPFDTGAEVSLVLEHHSLKTQVALELELNSTDFMISQWFIADVDGALGSLHCVSMGSVADISEVHAASIFRVELK